MSVRRRKHKIKLFLSAFEIDDLSLYSVNVANAIVTFLVLNDAFNYSYRVSTNGTPS